MKENVDTEKKWQAFTPDRKEQTEAAKPAVSVRREILRKFCSNRLAVVGLVIIFLVTVIAIAGPMLSPHTIEKMMLDYSNLPPVLSIYQIKEGCWLYMHPDYYFLEVSESGEILARLTPSKNDMMNRMRIFTVDDHEVTIDYGFQMREKAGDTSAAGKKFAVLLDGAEISVSRKVWNKTYLFGTDALGRDLFTRTMDGARLSLMIAAFSAVINSVIGILYGGIAGYCGGVTDNIMMRLVDVISTIPMTLIVIMLMVVLEPGVKTIILAMGIANWCTMARIVRSQILTLKEREFILAAKAANAGNARILLYHLIPNITATIIVCMTMMIPSAIFTESFLSFIGLGVSAPSASWGTLVNEGLSGFRSFPYQLLIPSASICITILAINFVGMGMQAAVNPYESD